MGSKYSFEDAYHSWFTYIFRNAFKNKVWENVHSKGRKETGYKTICIV